MQIHIFINRLRKYLDRDLFRSLNISTDIYYTILYSILYYTLYTILYYTLNKYLCIFTYLYLDIWSYKDKEDNDWNKYLKDPLNTNIRLSGKFLSF